MLKKYRSSTQRILLLLFAIAAGCASFKMAAVPRELDRSTVPHQIVAIQATRYRFTPEIIRVKAGTLLKLMIESTEGTHGLSMSDFDVDVRLDEHDIQTIEVYLQNAGEYGFRCSHFCGLGHLGMTGKIIVE